MIYYLAALLGLAIGSQMIGELGFEFEDPFVSVEGFCYD